MKKFHIIALFLSVGLIVSAGVAQAAVVATSTSLVENPIWVTGSSASTTVINVSLAADGGETLNALTIYIADASSTGFATSDLAALATGTTSGVSLYSASSGFVELAASPTWTGTGPYSVTLTPATPVAISAGPPSVFLIAVRTAGGLNSNTHKFIAAISANGITTSGSSPTTNVTSTASISIDAIPPTGISGSNFRLGNNQFSAQNGVSIGAEGDVVKVYASDNTTLLASSTLGPTGQFAPITVNTSQNTSVKVRVNDQAGNLSNTVDVAADAAPFVTSAKAFTDRIVLELSENVDGMQAMNCSANYIVNGTTTVCGGMGLPFVDFSGTKITIRGLNLSGTASFAIPTSTTITDLGGFNNHLTAYSSSSMSVQVLTLPGITSISPQSGAVGATVTITGTNFGTLGGGTMGDADHKVFFSGGFSQLTGPLPPVEADYTDGSWSNTSIVVKVPTGAQGGPVNVLSGGVMSDMGPNTFFDIAGSYTAKVYYSNNTSTPMDDADNGNIRIAIGGMNGETVYYVGDGLMTYNSSTDTFSITGVSSMGYTWAYDITGTHLNASGKEVSTAATQNLFMPATSRKISGTITLGASCTSGGQNKKVVVFAMPDNVDSGNSNFKQVEPAFFTTGGDCVANYAVGVPMNGTYRVETHVPPSTSGGITVSTAFTDPDAQSVTISSSTLTAVKNFTFGAATHRIVGTVQKPSGQFGSEERGKLWVFAYQPNGGNGTGAQVTASSTFTLNVSKGVWKVGVGGENMPFPVEVQVDVDDTYLISQPAKGPTIIIAPPSDFMEGYVKDSAGNGLSNVSLYAWLEGGPGNGNARTDSQGYYKMYVAPGANYHVGANSQSYGFLGEQSNIAVTSSTHPTVNFTVSSSDNYTISGTVTKGGTALQQAFVFITEGERGAMLGSGGTDANGAYSARVSGGANRWIHVGMPAKGEVYKANLGPISTSTTQNVTILSSTITVRVSPASDFSQAFVGVHSDQGGGFSDVDVAVASSSYREYQIDVQRPGSGSTTYYIDGGIPGFGPLSQNLITVNSNGTFTETSGTANDGIIEYTLGGFYSVSGTVTGSGVDGAWVWVSGPNGGGGTQTESNGTYTLKLRNGTYDIGVGKPGFIGNKIGITVNGAPLTDRNLTLTSAGQTITGTVYLPGGVTAVTNAWVWAQNNTGGWAGGSTDANGAYSLSVGSGSWDVQAAYDGYNSSSTSATAPAVGTNITLSTISGFSSNLKNSPITPSSGGIVQESGIKVDFPKNALGTDSSAGTIEVKNTTNIPSVASTKVIGNARDITARNSSNQNITTLSGNITVELTVTKAEIEAQGLSFAQVQGMKISYWDSTANNWVEISTSVTLHPATATSTAGLDSDPAVTLSGTVAHLSSFAPTVPADSAPATPTGLTATRDSSRPASQINLAWTAVSGATSYDIYSSTTSSGSSFGRIGSEPTVASGATVTYSDVGLAAGTTYYYKISALNSSGESAATVTPVSASTTAASSATGSLCTGLNCPVEGTVVSAPTASPAAGSYSSTQSVTLAATGASSIYYTIDGTTPTCTSGTLYSGAISISSTKTINAISCYPRQNNSAVTPFTYTLNLVDGSSSNVVLTSPTSGEADMPNGATSVVLSNTTTLDLSSSTVAQATSSVSIGGNTVSLTQNVTLQSGVDGDPIVLTNSSLASVSVSIPDGTKIQGPTGWNGIISPPATSTSSGTAPSGFTVSSTVISIGSASGTLVFDNPVTILLTGVTGSVGYKPPESNTWVKITTTCGGSYATPTSPTAPGECAIANGTNTKIVTYHFTSFGGLDPIPATPTPAPSSSGGGGGGGGGSSVSTNPYKVTINGGATSTASTNVTLALMTTSGMNRMWISNDWSFVTSTGTGWIPFQAIYSWTLTAGSGAKTVYVEFGNSSSTTPAGSATASITVTGGGTDTSVGQSTSETSSATTVSGTSGTLRATQIQLLNMLIAQLRVLLQQAQAQGITLPPGVDAYLNAGAGTSSVASAMTRDLTIGSTGGDVNTLQTILINENKGPAARALAAVGTTGYFGALTKTALKEYQQAVGITPVTGFFGPKTRAYINSR